MHNRILIRLSIFTTALGLAGATFAQTPTEARNAQIDARQASEQRRIERGVASGRLNPSETARLQQRQANIDAAQARANADGKVTRREQARLNARENRSSRAIFRKKHN